jgi:hypothetical protein
LAGQLCDVPRQGVHQLAADRAIANRPDRVDVGKWSLVQANHLFEGRVVGGIDLCVGSGKTARRLATGPEVDEHHAAAVAKDDIGRPDVSMQQSNSMRDRHAGQQLAR